MVCLFFLLNGYLGINIITLNLLTKLKFVYAVEPLQTGFKVCQNMPSKAVNEILTSATFVET